VVRGGGLALANDEKAADCSSMPPSFARAWATTRALSPAGRSTSSSTARGRRGEDRLQCRLILERQRDWKRAVEHWSSFQQTLGPPARPDSSCSPATSRASHARGEGQGRERAMVMARLRSALRACREREAAAVVDAAGQARFSGVESSFNDFMAVHFNYTRQHDLVYVLKVKNMKMNKLLEQYAEVIRIGSPRWSEAAFTRIGEAYRNFIKACSSTDARRARSRAAGIVSKHPGIAGAAARGQGDRGVYQSDRG